MMVTLVMMEKMISLAVMLVVVMMMLMLRSTTHDDDYSLVTAAVNVYFVNKAVYGTAAPKYDM
jgi:hypothetical protein